MNNLSAKLAGSIRQRDFDVFEDLFKEAAVSDLLIQCPSTRAALTKIASKGVGSRLTVASATKLANRDRFDVVQVRPSEFGYTVKWAAAPDGVQPQTQELSVPQAQQALPPEALQAADQQGVATMTGVEAEPDPLVEVPAPVEGFGMYKVTDTAGNQVVGYVIPSLFDPRTGQPTPMKLFVNGTAFALQPDMAGVLVGVNYSLPEGPSEPRGMGIFYKTNGKGIIATIPFNVANAVSVEGVKYYSATTMEGQPVQITPSEGLMRPIASSPTEIAMPPDYVWLPLNGQIELMGANTGADPMQQAKVASFSSSVTVRAWTDGYGGLQGAKLTGPVFDKIGSGDHNIPDALFLLAAAGMPQNLALAVMEKAASTGEPVRMYGLRTLSTQSNIVKEAFADALADLTLDTRGMRTKRASHPVFDGEHIGQFARLAGDVDDGRGATTEQVRTEVAKYEARQSKRGIFGGTPAKNQALEALRANPRLIPEFVAWSKGEGPVKHASIPQPVCLLKEAMAIEMHKEARTLVGVDSLDTLLSIGFINPENIQDFVDSIPELEETASKLAGLVFATQLGLQSVPESATIRAMTALDDVITGLKGLKTYKL
jgi:hypothetical protein